MIDGDLTRLACDAILIPTDESFWIEQPWRELVGSDRRDLQWDDDGMHRLPCKDRTPDVWLVDVGLAGHNADSSHFESRVEQFVDAALRGLEGRPNGARIWAWPKRRLAVNLVGSGRGGAGLRKGGLTRGLLATLQRLARDRDVDLVLVTFGERAYSAAQRVRRDLVDLENLHSDWMFDPAANPDLISRAGSLAYESIASRLVLFMGAGVSAGAGLPTWNKLLGDAAEEAGISPRVAGMLAEYDLRDQATVIESRLIAAGCRGLRDAVAERLRVFRHYALAHGLLASLPIDEAITTNFDSLFEAATATRPVAVLPSSPRDTNGRWLLKLHGSVDDPERIVLTRSDFLTMSRQYGALMGLVQGLLMMRHMMFVGYSLSDEDFHELVHEVRLARGQKQTDDPSGTVLTLWPNPVAAELWRNDLHVIAMMSDTTSRSSVDVHTASRQLDIFLDLLGFLSATTEKFFLDDTYSELANDESALRESLKHLEAVTLDATPGTVASAVQRFIRSLGGGPAS